jgi:hypothetical protein
MSAYEREHMIFGLLGQANLTQNDVLQLRLGILEAMHFICFFKMQQQL